MSERRGDTPPESRSEADRLFYEGMYRTAREYLRAPAPKALRKHWQKQLWTARACLKSYFGAEPPPEGGVRG